MLLCDTARDIGVKYGAADSNDARAAQRIAFLIDEDGRLQRCYGKVKPKDHPEQVLSDLG